MARRLGLQADVLVSLSIVMVMATGVLGAVIVKTHEARVFQLHRLTTRSLVNEAESPFPPQIESVNGIGWWWVGADGQVTPRGTTSQRIDERSRALAGEAREQGKPLLLAGPPWEPLRFATPLARGNSVAVAWLPGVVSPSLLVALLVAVVAVFTVFGAFLLRHRVVVPLQRLAAAARQVAEGGAGARVAVAGVAETAEVGAAFNHMTEALEKRSDALEKAVAELRESNRSLREVRDGLDRAERLASVGRLAAGVAHEVGNPMGAILAFLDLACRDEGISSATRGYLERAAREGTRVRTILRQLLDFSRPPRTARIPVNLVAVCEEAAALVRAQKRYARVDIRVAAEGDPPFALADPDGVAQIVLNLLLNAVDAITAISADATAAAVEVTVRAATRHRRDSEDDAAASERRSPDAIECVFADNGPGIPDEDRERIFDPFFSTKGPGEGTGLGLSNAVRFAEEFGGSLELSNAGEATGATFVLRLPAAEPESGGASAGVRGS
jgi:signal transduction histidine kinase